MEIILIWIAGLVITGLSTASYVHRSRQRAFLTKPLKVDRNLRNRVARALGVDGAVVTGVSMFDVLYNTMKMDPQALRGMEHLHHAQGFESLGDLMDFMKREIIKSEPGEDAWRQMIHKYKGYTGEKNVADNFRDQGRAVEVPESGTAKGLDIIVDGKQYNIKVTDNPRYIQEHLDRYPDIDVITNREMADAFRNNPRVLIDSDLSVQEAFHSTADTFEGIADLGDGIDNIPFISLAFNVVKNSRKLYKGDLDLKTAAEHTVLDTAATGVGGLLGSKIGLGLGLALAPVTGGLSTVFMPILGSLAGVFTGKGISGWFKERHLRRAIEQIQNLATEFQAVFLDLYQNVVNAMSESFKPSLKMCRRRVVEEGFFRRTVFPSVKTTFYRMASEELKTERGDMRSFYTELYHAVQDTEEPIEGGMILFANCQEQGVGILYDVEPLPDYYAAMEAQLEIIEAEERKLS